MSKVEIIHTFNEAYSKGGAIDEYGFSEVSILLNGEKIYTHCASESLSECPEDARFSRSLNDPADVISLVRKLLEGNAAYEVTVRNEQEE